MGEIVKDILFKIDLNEIVNQNDIENLIKDKDVFKKYEILQTLSKLLRKKRVFAIQQRNLYEKIENHALKEAEKQKIREIRRVQKIVTDEIKALVFPAREKQSDKENIPAFLKMQISNLSDIKCMHYLLDDEAKGILEQLEETIEPAQKLNLIETLIIKFEQILKELQTKLNEVVNSFFLELRKNEEYNFKLKKEKFKKFLSNKKYESFKIDIDYYNVSIKGVKTLLERLYTLKGIQKAAIAKEEKDKERRNSNIFIDDPKDIVNTVLDECSLDIELKEKFKKVSKLFFALLNLIEKEEECIDLEEYVNFFMITFENLQKEEIVCLCNVFRSSLKSRCNELKSLEFDTSLLRKRLKKLMNSFQEKKKEVLNCFVEDEKDYYVNIFKPLLDDDLNYYYFSRILDEIKSDLSSNEIKNLLEKIIDLFIVNYKYKLANQNFNYIEPKYYESLLILFIKHNLVDDSLKSFIIDRLEDFKDVLCKKEDISQAKSEALKMIDDLIFKLDGFVESKIDSSRIKGKIESLIIEKMPYIIANHQRLGFFSGEKEKYKDLDYSTFVVGDYVYSKRYNEEGDLFFQIHILDTTSFITENECIDEDIKNSNVTRNDISFEYEKGKKYPVQTFQFRIYQNNSVGNMKIFSNIIEIDSIYSKDDLVYYRDNNDLKSLVSACKRIGNFCLDDFDIDKNTSLLLSSYIIDFLNGFEKEVPMMYRRDCGEIFNDLSIYNHNQICYYLSKIEKRKAHQIFYILDEMPEDIYTNYPTFNSYLSLDPFSYSGIYLIRTIKKLIKEEYLFNDEEYNNEKAKVIGYCKSLNKSYGYVSDRIMKQDKTKNIDKR